MIDNVVLLITGTLHERDTSELLEKCHPLGMFDAMATLTVATNTQELFNSVLVDTPLAPYFAQCLSEEDLDEMNIEIIRNTLYKAYLEDFYQYCKKLGGDTADFMGQILPVRAFACALRSASCLARFRSRRPSFRLPRSACSPWQFEADRRAINITINSFGTELTKDDRAKLYPSFGRLYPEGTYRLYQAADYEAVATTCSYYPVGAARFRDAPTDAVALTERWRYVPVLIHTRRRRTASCLTTRRAATGRSRTGSSRTRCT